jgi:hypothetical protein
MVEIENANAENWTISEGGSQQKEKGDELVASLSAIANFDTASAMYYLKTIQNENLKVYCYSAILQSLSEKGE